MKRPPLFPLCLAVTLLLLLLPPGEGRAIAFPLYDRVTSHADEPTTDTWVLYPFFSIRETTSTTTTALHPLWDWHVDHETGRRELDVLYPLYTWRHHPSRGQARDHDRTLLFPLYFQKREDINGREHFSRILVPIWFQGHQGEAGEYRILFPFFWYAYNARLAVPLFPGRPQTFAALWPIMGDFRGYYNRDRIFFFLWPLFVHSSAGTGADFVETNSLLWPFLARHDGPRVSGFRIWPLLSWVDKQEEFTRAYFLWPLGHYRSGRISSRDAGEEHVSMFLPFYARIRRPNMEFDLVFPFRGRLEVGKREVDGYLLALHNRDRNHRTNIEEERILWFVYRHRTVMDDVAPDDVTPATTLGGGLFPLYVNVTGETRGREHVLWPIYTKRWSRHADHDFLRTYLFPLFSSQKWEYTDGRERHRRFYFPFFRQTRTIGGEERANSLHLWFHSELDPVDRLYAPLWEFWRHYENEETGEEWTRWFQNAYRHERKSDGTERRRANLLLFQRETLRNEDGSLAKGSTQLLGGLLGLHRSEEQGRELELLWMKF